MRQPHPQYDQPQISHYTRAGNIGKQFPGQGPLTRISHRGAGHRQPQISHYTRAGNIGKQFPGQGPLTRISHRGAGHRLGAYWSWSAYLPNGKVFVFSTLQRFFGSLQGTDCAGRTRAYLKHPCFALYDPYRRMGRGLDSRANGSFPKGARRLSEKLPARHPPPHRRDGIAWERGRPARILSLWPPLSFSAMLQAATLWAGTASARPKESHGAVPG